MRIKFDLVETNIYRMDIELPESVLLLYCEAHGVSIEDVESDPELHANGISKYFMMHHEDYIDIAEFIEGEMDYYNPELEV